jgi:hypothetical protein
MTSFSVPLKRERSEVKLVMSSWDENIWLDELNLKIENGVFSFLKCLYTFEPMNGVDS